MDQTEARKFARQTGGQATQESRYYGQFAKPGEPWIVVVNGRIYREVPESRKEN